VCVSVVCATGGDKKTTYNEVEDIRWLRKEKRRIGPGFGAQQAENVTVEAG